MSTIAGPVARQDYRAFGMVIRSDLPLPATELHHIGEPQVEIVHGFTPNAMPEAVTRDAWFHAAPDRLLLKIEGVARYLVEAGRCITIERQAGATDDDVRVFLLGSALGALLHQRRVLVLHGSAIEVRGEAVAFLGGSGAGKSTLATALGQRGCPVLTDDLCVIAPGPRGEPCIESGLARTKLRRDALEQLGIPAEALRLVDQRMKKRALPVDDTRPREPVPIRKVYELRASERDEISITPLRGAEKFRALMRHTYRLCFIEGLGVQASHFRQALALAGRMEMSIVDRPTEPFRLRELADRIVADLDAARWTARTGEN